MKVLVTGGTGFVGQEVVRQLHGLGHTRRVLVRNPQSEQARDMASRYGAEISRGDVLDANSLEEALKGVDAVIHLVGIINEVGQSTFENVHTRGTQNLLAAAQRAGVRRFVQMSALGTRAQAVSRYHQSKWAAEVAVRGSGLVYTIFRPSLIYGPGDHFVNLFAKIIRLSPVVPVMGSGRARFQPVAVEAVGRAFVGALREPNAIGQTYDLCGPEMFTLAQMLDEILTVMGRKRWKLRIPLVLARCQAASLELIFGRVLGKAPPLNRDQLTMLEEDNVGDGGPANEMFGLRHTHFREGIAGYVKRDA
jgi:uncharacterized protein YbjT (DUF2867 family)